MEVGYNKNYSLCIYMKLKLLEHCVNKDNKLHKEAQKKTHTNLRSSLTTHFFDEVALFVLGLARGLLDFAFDLTVGANKTASSTWR